MKIQIETHKNSKRLMRALVFGLVGVLVLSVSAFAAYGSTSGYGKYKDAVKALVTDVDNMTCTMKTTLQYDGKTVSNDTVDTLLDGKNGSTHDVDIISGETTYESYSTTIDGTTTSFSNDDNSYYQSKDGDFYNNMFFGEESDKVVNFAELLADTVLGDLKNNVVLVSSKDDVNNYTLDLTTEQIPAVVNAGLSLMAASDDSLGWVQYENSDVNFAAYYKETTGNDLPDGYIDKVNNSDDEDLWNEYNDMWSDMDAKYEDILNDKYDNNAIIYVKTDGSYEVYDSYDAYAEECLTDSGYISDYLTDNAVLTEVVCNFSINDDNQLLSNEFAFTFTTVDTKGNSHQVVYTINADFSDYGSTVVSPLDVGGRTLATY